LGERGTREGVVPVGRPELQPDGHISSLLHVTKLRSVMFPENKGETGPQPAHLETVLPPRERDKGGEKTWRARANAC
jgi:hypothetical protein